MKKKLSRTFQRAVASLLACVMLAGCLELPALAASADPGAGRSDTTALRLWYDEPASQTGTPGSNGSGVGAAGGEGDKWQQDTLPIGNGTIGATVYGEIGTERLLLNEQTLWSGGPSESRPNYMGGNIITGKGENGATLRHIVETYLNTGNIVDTGKMTGSSDNGYGYYLPWGELNIATSGLTSTSGVTGYERWLSLDDALAGVAFTSGGVDYTREYLVSNPDNVLAVRLTASQSKTFTITLPSRQGGTTVAEGDTLKLCGQLADNQLKYASFLKVVPGEGTSVTGSGSSLTVTGTEFTLFFSAATDYKADYPVYRTGESDAELAARVLKRVTDAAGKGYAAVKRDHMDDYHSLYNRVSLDLGQASTSKTTDALLSAYNNGTASETERRLLEVMLFQYGRYLTIASSREDSQLPSNLQGIWNYHDTAPWHSDFHTNVNLQMNYWPVYSTNLTECAYPMIQYIDDLREPGRVTAKVYAGIESTPENPENGFMAHTQNTPWGWTCPGWSFEWGWAPAAIAWMLQNCWEHYEYTGDVEFMKNNIYPMMKEYARLYDQLLVDIDPSEDVVYATVPAYSPEHGPATAGNTFEHSLVWQLYTDCITAATLLDDTEYVAKWTYMRDHLKGPIEIGDEGQIKEWYHETGISKDENGNTMGQGNGHRHLSHMLGLFPGDLIQTREDWIEAARVSMNARVDQSTGWGMGQRINTWARLRDGNHAYDLIKYLFSSGMYVNLWDAHAPFQIDGNFGYTAGVAEMLVQSNMGFIDLLPALPDAWAAGSFEGLVARGNFVVNAAWEDGALTDVSITSKNGGECVVSYPNLSRAVVKDGGSLIEFEIVDNDKISFPTAKGRTYTITEIPAREISVVEGAAAYRTDDDTAELFWTAQTGETYQVYRQVENGEVLPLEDAAAIVGGKASFKDAAAYAAMGEIKYYISVNGAELGNAIPLVDMRNQTIDDDDSAIVYSAGPTSTTDWGHYDNHNEGTYMETVKFVENAVSSANDVGQTIEFSFYGTGIQVIGGWNTNHGQMSVGIDGVNCGTADFYGTRTFQKMIWEKTDLTRGVHTIKLTRLYAKNSSSSNYKIEFDAFKVLDTGAVETPETLAISTVGNVEKLWNAGDTVQFTANLEGVTWTATSSVTHATTCNYPNHKFSWNANTQTLTAGLTDETITVTATKGSQTASKQITITPKTTVTIVEDSVTSGVPNPAIHWGGNWATWNGEATKHHGGSKTENNGNLTTDYIEYTFNGTGIAIYGTRHFNNGAATVTIDGEAREDAIFGAADGTDLAQVKLAEYTGLSNGEHTIRLTAKTYNSKTHLVLDFFEVHAPNPNAPQADLEDLKKAVAEAAAYHEESYTAESWKALADALATAGDYLNNTVVATQTQANAAAAAIRSAITGLKAKPLAAPLNLAVILVEGTAITLKWDAASGADSYQITVGDRTIESNSTVCRVDGLAPATKYTFSVKSKNTSGLSENAATVPATTKDTVAPSQPTGLAWDDTTKTLSWTASSDNVGVVGYKVLVNGTAQGDAVAGTFTTLDLSGTQNSLSVIAVDAAGNESFPAVLVVAPVYTVDVTGGTTDGGKSSFKAGEAVTVNATIPAGHIFKGWTATGVDLGDKASDATLSFPMPATNVTLTASTEAKSWSVTADLTNLTSDLAVSEVSHGSGLNFTLTPAKSYYSLPDSIQVTMGGTVLQAPWVTYSSVTGKVSIREVTGDVVITAATSQTVSGSYTAEDPFYLPGTEGESAVLEAENLVGSGTGLGYVSFGNQCVTGFDAGDTLTLYYNAPVAGTYTLTLNYRSTADGDNPHNFNWSGDNVDDHNDTVVSTLVDGKGTFKTIELDFEVIKAGPGVVVFTANALADGAGDHGGPDIDSMTFTLRIGSDSTPIDSITLDKRSATLYLNGTEDEGAVTLAATVLPADASNKELRWTSSDPTVAYVNQDGVVGARGNGTATITAAAMDGSGRTATAEITVKTRVTGTVTISGVPQFGKSLVAFINSISHQEAKKDLAYQWKRDGVAITGAITRYYDVTSDDIGHAITVTVTAADPYVGAANGTTSAPVTGAMAKGPDVIDTLAGRSLETVDFGVDEETGAAVKGRITGLNPAYSYEYKPVTGSEDDWEAVPMRMPYVEVDDPGDYHVRVAATATGTVTAGDPSRTLTILAAGSSGNAINFDDSTTGGVVRANVSKAAADTPVTLTVFPAEGYQLKDGTLKVNGETVVVTNNSATFTMPAGAATVTAEFEKKTYTISHDLEYVTCSMGAGDHQVTHGEAPVITISADEGYDLPQVITVTMTEGEAPFTDYEYDYAYNNDTVTGRIVFTNGIPGDLTIEGVGIKKTLDVSYALFGVTSLGGPRTVKYGDPLTLTITPKTGYQLPESTGITVKMAGNDVAFTYVKDETANTATLTIGANVITDSLTITVQGVSDLPALTGVTVTGTAQVGQQLTATVAPAIAFADYQWIRVEANGNQIPIPGAVNRTYVIKAADAGCTIKVAATGVNKHSGTVYSAPTGTVANVNVVSVTGVTVNAAKQTITAGGDPLQLNAVIAPDNASNKAVQWSSSDELVAIVISSGVVYGRKPGKATITATTVSGSKTATYEITVVAVSLPETATVQEGRTIDLTPIVPDDLPDKNYTWTSDNTGVATVDENGTVTGVSVGSTKIKVTTGTGFTADCTVTVSRAVAKLASLSVKHGDTELITTFNADTTSYTATVANTVESVTVTATGADDAAVAITKGGAECADGVVALAVGEDTVVTVTVTNGSATKDYTVTITRKAPDREALTKAIADANNAKAGVETIDDKAEAEVDSGTRFVTTAEMKALTDAIEKAQAVADKTAATQDEVDDAVTALDNAVTTFNGVIKTGTYSTFIPTLPTNTPTTPDTTTTTTTDPDGTKTTTVTDNKTGTVTATTEKPDGTVETVETKKDGTKTETTKNTDGSSEVVETKPDGTVTETNTDAEGSKVEKVTTPEKDVTVTVTDPEGEVLAKVDIPAEIPAPETRFEDVPEGHWADEAIHNMAALEVVNGVGNNTFDRNGDMKRGDLALVLSRMSSATDKSYDLTFDDVPATKYYANGVAWAAKTGVVTGRSAETFAPEATITREELAVMLYRYAKLLKLDAGVSEGALDAFNDGGDTHGWAEEGMAWCVDKGILQGKGNGILDPRTNVTRAEVAVMLKRFMDLMK